MGGTQSLVQMGAKEGKEQMGATEGTTADSKAGNLATGFSLPSLSSSLTDTDSPSPFLRFVFAKRSFNGNLMQEWHTERREENLTGNDHKSWGMGGEKDSP